MEAVIDLEHVRRGKRLLGICIKQFGAEHYFIDDAMIPRIDGPSVEDTVDLACSWIGRRTDRDVTAGTAKVLRDMLKKHLVRRLCTIATARGL